ncbi:protein SLOW GREEN 1, chloroplastic-like [Rutidosis leptorrhynchoides]|uniref:protein SLOW GREEN 1, chloroplastic-like n=1 Tax=Rutidosis leptorrhynchoides TaxID=125765 RepID=UPI003A9A2F62
MILNSSALGTPSSFINLNPTTSSTNSPSSLVRFKLETLKLKALSSNHSDNHKNPPPNDDPRPGFDRVFKSLCNTAVFVAVTAFMIDGFPRSRLPAMAESPAVLEEQKEELEGDLESSRIQDNGSVGHLSSVSEFAVSNIGILSSIMKQKLEEGEAMEAFNILKRMGEIDALEWKLVMSKMLTEMGRTEDARKLFEEIPAASKPLSFEASFENALLMDLCGEEEAVLKRLEEALTLAKEENSVDETREARLIMAQIKFFQDDVEEALASYRQLAMEDPADYRPYYCQAMIYSLRDMNKEAKEMFAKYYELAHMRSTPLPKIAKDEGWRTLPMKATE